MLSQVLGFSLTLSAQTDSTQTDSTSIKPRMIWTQPDAIKYFDPY